MEEILKMPDNITYVSTLSGGLDSALATYLLMYYKPGTRVVLSSICLEHMDNYNLNNVKNIRTYLQKHFPDRIREHRIGYFADRDAARSGRGTQTSNLVTEFTALGLLSGMTLNPIDVPELMDSERDDTRDAVRPVRTLSRTNIWHYQPFINHDKKYVAELYQQHNLQDLADLTVSCESLTSPRPCKTCWWCREKHWAFGYY